MFRFQGWLSGTHFGWIQRAHSVCGPKASWLTHYLACFSYGPALPLKEKLLKRVVTQHLLISFTLEEVTATRRVLSRECLGRVWFHIKL